jgi:SagB-type dehydrogenase family enzyme
MKPLNLRLDEEPVVSTDDGRTSGLEPQVAAAIRSLLPSPSWDVPGATAPERGISAEAIATRPRRGVRPTTPRPFLATGASVPLGAMVRLGSRPLATVLEARSSARKLDGSLPLTALATILVRTLRIRICGGDSGWTSRPIPSAGGLHPCDVIVYADNVIGLEPGYWWFDAWTCELRRLASTSTGYGMRKSLEVHGFRSWAAVLILAADFDLVRSRYPAPANLVWRDAGILLATLHLVSTDISIDSCIVANASIPRSVLGSRINAGILLLGGTSA